MNNFDKLYKQITINNFRGIKHLEIKNLNRINIFFGPNNCGKTSVLEAVFSTACGYNIDPLIKVLTGTRSGNKFKSYSEFGNKLITLFNDVNQTPYEYEGKTDIALLSYLLLIYLRVLKNYNFNFNNKYKISPS